MIVCCMVEVIISPPALSITKDILELSDSTFAFISMRDGKD